MGCPRSVLVFRLQAAAGICSVAGVRYSCEPEEILDEAERIMDA